MSGLLIVSLTAFATFFFDDDGWQFIPLGLCAGGLVFYTFIYNRYRNTGEHHDHERETKADFDNLQRYDNFVEHRKKLRNANMNGRNDHLIEGSLVKSDPLGSVENIKQLVKSYTQNS